jgi:hypothetical protein
MGYNRAGQRAKVKLRRRRKEERRLALKSHSTTPAATGVVDKVKRAATTAKTVAKAAVEGFKEGLAAKKKK